MNILIIKYGVVSLISCVLECICDNTNYIIWICFPYTVFLNAFVNILSIYHGVVSTLIWSLIALVNIFSILDMESFPLCSLKLHLCKDLLLNIELFPL